MFVRARTATAVTITVAAIGLTGFLAGSASAASVASDAPAALVVVPKVQLDSVGAFLGASTDTTVQLTNTNSLNARAVHCFYVDATRHCAVSGAPCTRTAQCTAIGGVGDFCDDPTWAAENFTLVLSPNQTVGWNVSAGLQVPGPGSGAIPPVVDDPFIGELKCLEMTDSSAAALPLNANDLIGTVTTITTNPGGTVIDARAYSAIGIQASLSDQSAQNDLILCLGGTPGSSECPVPPVGQVSEYAACPRSLWMNHFFDGTPNLGGATRSNRLTLVPCSENFEEPDLQLATTVQFLVYNEFEQRFSARTTVDCYADLELVFIDSRVTGQNSVFSIGVQGTIGGQTLIKPVLGSETNAGHGLLGVAEQALLLAGAPGPSTAAFNLNHSGANPQGDVVRFIIP